MNGFAQKLGVWMSIAARPVRKEFWFFFCIFGMMVQQPIEWMCLYCTDYLWQLYKFGQGLLALLGVTYVATLIVYLTRSRIVKGLLYFIFWLLMGITFFLIINFDMSISQQALTPLVETNSKESAEFVNTYMWTTGSIISYIIDLVVAVIIIVGEYYQDAIRRFLRRAFSVKVLEYTFGPLCLAGVALIVVVYTTLFNCNNSHQLYHWRTIFPPESFEPVTQSLHAINSLRAFDNDVVIALNTEDAVYKTHPTVSENDSLTIIYVLGETYNKHHASLYGYKLPTTPCMDREKAEGRLFAFTNAVAQENITSIVEKNSFSLNSVGDGEAWFDFPNFTTIFRRAGYDVWMWDMQRTWQSSKLFTITVNSFIYHPKTIKLSYTACNDYKPEFDGGLIDDFAQEVTFKNKHNLVFFHLMGQHVNYKNRYPKDTETVDGNTVMKYAPFSWKDVPNKQPWMNRKKKETVADYDNATYYNDYVMNKIFDLFKDKNAVVVYMGDHGEELYDFRDLRGRQSDHIPPPGMLRYQNEVPFIVWCSPRYQQLHPDIMARIRTSINRPVMTDLVGQLLLDLGRVNTEYYKPERDYISPQFKPRHRLTYDNRIDYDATMATEKSK